MHISNKAAYAAAILVASMATFPASAADFFIAAGATKTFTYTIDQTPSDVFTFYWQDASPRTSIYSISTTFDISADGRYCGGIFPVPPFCEGFPKTISERSSFVADSAIDNKSFNVFYQHIPNVSPLVVTLFNSGPSQIAFFDFGIAAPSAVPEPSTWALMFAGLATVGGAFRHRGRKPVASQA